MLQRLARLAHAPPLLEQMGAHGVHQLVALQGRLLHHFIGQADIAHHARQRADDPGRHDAPDGIDRRVQVTCHPSRG